MQLWWLDFHESTRFSKTHSEYQEQPYSLEKTTIVFLDPPKKMHVTFVGYSWNNRGIFLYSIFPEHFFGIFFGAFSGYSGNILWECFTNIPRTYTFPVGYFQFNSKIIFKHKQPFQLTSINVFLIRHVLIELDCIAS